MYTLFLYYYAFLATNLQKRTKSANQSAQCRPVPRGYRNTKTQSHEDLTNRLSLTYNYHELAIKYKDFSGRERHKAKSDTIFVSLGIMSLCF